MKKIVLFLALCLSTGYFAQTFSGFGVTSVTYKFHPKWMAYAEFQARSIEEFSTPDYFETKGGIGYNFKKNHQPFLGIGRYGTYREREFYQEEIRLWAQYTFTQNFGKLKVDHRGRAEKRFYNYPQSEEKKDTERYRYRLSTTLPLNNVKVEENTLFASVFEEIFVGPEEPVFKRSRFFSGVGYQFDKNVGTVAGYMWQKEFSASGNKNLHFLYWGLNLTIDAQQGDDRVYDIPVGD